MNKNLKCGLATLAACGLVTLVGAAYAADPAVPANGNTAVRSNSVNPSDQPNANATATTHAPMTHSWRASQLEKMNVRNNAGEKIGAIEDLVVTPDGRVAYAALGFGGFLGMGEKLFAVPWKNLHMHRADANNSEDYILLNVTKEELKTAPGFDKAHWPNFADPNFTQGVDQFYKNHTSSRDAVGETR